MHEFIWGIIALILLLVLSMFGLAGQRGNGLTPHNASFEDLIEGGVFLLALMIVAAPILGLWVLVRLGLKQCGVKLTLPAFFHDAEWRRRRTAPLAADDDPRWGRPGLKKRAEEVFRLVQDARTKRDAILVADVATDKGYTALQLDITGLIARQEMNVRCDIQISELLVYNELKAAAWGDSFQVDVDGTMVNYVARQTDGLLLAGSLEACPFHAHLTFVRPTEGSEEWKVFIIPGPDVPGTPPARAKRTNRRRTAAKVESTAR